MGWPCRARSAIYQSEISQELVPMSISSGVRFQGRRGKGLATQYFVTCQAAWFVAVYGGARGSAIPALLCAAVLLSWHLLRAAKPLAEARIVALVTTVGWTWDSLVAQTGWLAYPGHAIGTVHAPLWIAALWALFSIQLNVVFTWLRGRWWLAAALGAVGGPMSFRAGAALGAVRFAHPEAAICALAAGWAILMPAAVWVASRWDGVAGPLEPSDVQT
jgi:hypothetical protein